MGKTADFLIILCVNLGSMSWDQLAQEAAKIEEIFGEQANFTDQEEFNYYAERTEGNTSDDESFE
jgi:hypothetical protein